MRFRYLPVLGILAFAACGDSIPGMLPEPVASIDVAAPNSLLAVGATVQLTATARSGSGAALPGRPLLWSSSDTLVATVSPAGLVTARAPGTATVRAAAEGRSGEVVLSVAAPVSPVAEIRLTPPVAPVIRVGDQIRFTALPLDSAGHPLEDRPVTWASDTAGVATIDGTGLVTALTAGRTVISATIDGRTVGATLTVVASYPFQLMFDAGYGTDPHILRLDLDLPNAEPQRITQQWAGWDVTASPDGSLIAFTCVIGHGTAICVATRDGRYVQVLTSPSIALADQPAWSPDGTRIAYRGWAPGGPPGPFNPSHIRVMNRDGTGKVTLTGGSPAGRWQESPTWSPADAGGRHRIAYSEQRISDGFAVGRIFSVRDDGGDIRAVTTGGEYLETEPTWSPDGTTIAFVRTGGTAAGDIWLVNAAGGNERQLMQIDPADDQQTPAWSPDGALIAFSSRHEPTLDGRWSYQVYTVRADGTDLTRRTHVGGDRSRPAWILRH